MVEVILLLIQCERLQKFSNLRVHAVAELRKVILVNREQRSYA
jgi:preprotein translocase subunit SecE